MQADEGFQYLQVHLLPAREQSHKSAHSRCLHVEAASTLMTSVCVCVSTVPFSQEVADGRLVQSLFFVEKLGHRLRPPLQEVVLHQVVDSLKQDGRGEISMKSSDSD